MSTNSINYSGYAGYSTMPKDPNIPIVPKVEESPEGLHPKISRGALAQMMSARENCGYSHSEPVAASVYLSNEGAVDPVFDSEGFSAFDVYEFMTPQENPAKEGSDLIKSSMRPKVAIGPVVNDLQSNIVALSNGIGAPFGTGLLIDNYYVLTGRHCLEGLSLEKITVRVGFQKLSENMVDFGELVSIEGCVEEDDNLDYAIIKLKSPIEGTFKEVQLDITQINSDSNPPERCLLFHHPDGSPKKVSLGPTLEAKEKMVAFAGANFSKPGSSGGVYVTPHKQIVALHQIRAMGVTGAKFISEIYAKSPILKQLYPGGNYKNIPDLAVSPSSTYLKPKEDPAEYLSWLEVITQKPSNYPKANEGNTSGVDLAHHHIIPKGNMEFMWMIGEESPKIKAVLQKVFASPSIKQVIWARWNVFTGPSRRYNKQQLEAKLRQSVTGGYDPENDMEPTCPQSFDKGLWGSLDKLNKSIERCWAERSAISRQTRLETIGDIDRRVAIKINPSSTQAYSDAIDELEKVLMAEIEPKKNRDIFPVILTDWDYIEDGRYALKV